MNFLSYRNRCIVCSIMCSSSPVILPAFLLSDQPLLLVPTGPSPAPSLSASQTSPPQFALNICTQHQSVMSHLFLCIRLLSDMATNSLIFPSAYLKIDLGLLSNFLSLFLFTKYCKIVTKKKVDKK